MKPLRAFLFSYGSNKEWASTPFRELEPLLDAARLALQAEGESAAIHIGFWRPETGKVAELAKQWPGLILISQAVISALPPPVKASSVHVGEVDGLHFFLALEGFGYEIDDPIPNAARKNEIITESINYTSNYSPRDWVEHLVGRKPQLREYLEAAGIWDETSYHEKENGLDNEKRLSLALDRFETVVGEQPSSLNILINLEACPRWLLSDELSYLDLTVRMRNVIQRNNLINIKALHTLGYSGLFKLRHLGKGSIHGLGLLVWKCFQHGDSLKRFNKSNLIEADWPILKNNVIPEFTSPLVQDNFDKNIIFEFENFIAGFQDSIQILNENERQLWLARIGYQQEPKTLQNIAETVKLTRERIRQIETKVYNKIQHHSVWIQLSDRLTTHFSGRVIPLLFNGLSAIDPWFNGIDDLRRPLEVAFSSFLGGCFSIIDIGETPVITRLTNEEWADAVVAGKSLLREMVTQRVNEDEVRNKIEILLSERGAELRVDLWSEIRPFAIWAKRTDGPALLTGYGRTAEAVVAAVLEEAGHPLHFSEIHRRASLISPKSHVERRLHNAASTVAVLFARGTYGLLSHCPLGKNDLALIEAEVENICSDSDSERQWHTSELLDELLERGLDFDGKLTKYIVNIALQQSKTFVYMKRMVWGYRKRWTANAASRLDMRQAVMALLEEAGRPLSTLEIRERLKSDRGVNVDFQIHPMGNLIRMGSGLWGLADRDIKVANPDALLDRIVRYLNATQEGLHVSEIAELLGGGVSDEDTKALIGLIKKKGMRGDRAQYVYIASWENSRRVWPSDAVEQALNTYAQGATIEQIRNHVNRLTRRDIAGIYISQILAHLEGASYDPKTELWKWNSYSRDTDYEINEEDETLT